MKIKKNLKEFKEILELVCKPALDVSISIGNKFVVHHLLPGNLFFTKATFEKEYFEELDYEETVEISINAITLLKFLKMCKSELEMEVEENQLILISGKSRYSTPINSDEKITFQAIEVEFEYRTKLDSKEFFEKITNVTSFEEQINIRAKDNGISLEFETDDKIKGSSFQETETETEEEQFAKFPSEMILNFQKVKSLNENIEINFETDSPLIIELNSELYKIKHGVAPRVTNIK